MFAYLFQLKKIMLDQKINLAILILFCFLFEWLFAWIFFESGISKIIVSFIRQLPAGVTAFIGMQNGISQFPRQMLAFGYVHPVMIVSLAFLQISIPTRYITQEIELKTFDLLLTKPVKRMIIPLSIITFLVMAIILQFTAMLLGTLAGKICFNLNIHMMEYMRTAAVGLVFFLSMGSIATAVSTFQNEKGKAMGIAIGLFVFLYFFDTIVKLSKTLQYLSPYSYFQLYQPGKLILKETNPGICALIALVITVVFFLVALIQFNRRDY